MRVLTLRIIFTFLILFVLSSCGSQSVKDSGAHPRQIGYVEQEKPGALIILTLTDSGRMIGGSILDAKAGMRENRFSITEEQFSFIWTSLNSPGISKYQFTPKKTDSMSNPKFYTISKISEAGDQSYRIPVESGSPESERVIDALKAVIASNS